MERQSKREAVVVDNTADQKVLTSVQQTSASSETPSISTVAGSTMMATKGTKMASKGIVKTVEDFEESKSMTLPIFSNQKDILNQARKSSQLRAGFATGK